MGLFRRRRGTVADYSEPVALPAPIRPRPYFDPPLRGGYAASVDAADVPPPARIPSDAAMQDTSVEILLDFARAIRARGIHADTMPAIGGRLGDGHDITLWYAYLRDIDTSMRDYARAVLERYERATARVVPGEDR